MLIRTGFSKPPGFWRGFSEVILITDKILPFLRR